MINKAKCHISYVLFCLLIMTNIVAEIHAEEEVQFSVQATTQEKMSLGVVVVGQETEQMKSIVARLQKDLQYSGQFWVCQQHILELKKVSELKHLFSDAVSIALFISYEDGVYIWRLYDLISCDMMDGKKVAMQDCSTSCIAHVIADDVWQLLLGYPGSFSSKIAYCKQIWRKKQGRDKVYKQIWITDFDGSNQQLFIDVPTVSFAPRWSNLNDCPILFYSENTLSNIQLVMANMYKKRQVISSFDGLNMQPAFSANGKEMVFCLSKDGSSQLYHTYVDALSQKRKYDRLTNNDGNNIAPCFIDMDHIVFVSDFEYKRPQLYKMHVGTKKIELLTDGKSYCACPCYCPANNKLVYSKKVDGPMQLILYDFTTKEHTQVTKGGGSKEEPSWSACGTFITFGLNEGLKSRIAQLNLITGKVKYITAFDEHCTYPSCSPVYQELVGVLKN